MSEETSLFEVISDISREGVIADLRSDDGYYSDSSEDSVVEGGLSFYITEAATQEPLSDKSLESSFDLELVWISLVSIDLLRLVPEKFRTSQILVDYLDEAGIQVSTWLSYVRDISKILNTRTTSDTTYLRNLGAMIGVVLPPKDSASVAEMKKSIQQAIEWYKVKGSYTSIDVISNIQTLTTTLYDMYTNDYTTFVLTEWFVGDENENPPGLDSSYYKSPHFGLEISLNRVFTDIGGEYLWASETLDNLAQKVEETRPVHTVPHYLLFLNPRTDESRNVYVMPGEITSRVTANWTFTVYHLDEPESSETWSLDEGIPLDASLIPDIYTITKWCFGTGTSDITDPSWSVASPVLIGSIDPTDIVVTDQKITFNFIVPKTVVQDGLTELGLYIPGAPDVLVAGSTFPSIDKDDREELRVAFEVYLGDLT